jgi:hypothetical protein
MPSLFRFMISFTLEWDALRNNLQFQKSSPNPKSKEISVELFNPLTQRICVGRRVPSTQSCSILF